MSDRWEELARDFGKFAAQALEEEPPPSDCSDIEWYAHMMKMLGMAIPRSMMLRAVGEWRKHFGLDR